MGAKLERSIEKAGAFLRWLQEASRQDEFNIDTGGIFRQGMSKNWEMATFISGETATSDNFDGEYKSQALIDLEEKIGGVPRKGWVFEHIIPVSVVMEHLKYIDLSTNEKVEEFLNYATNVCAVTKEEDKALTEAGLQFAMPEGWEWGDDPFLRYNAVGIVAKENIKVQKIFTVKIWGEDKVYTKEFTRSEMNEFFDPENKRNIRNVEFDGTFHATNKIPGVVGFAYLKVEERRVK